MGGPAWPAGAAGGGTLAQNPSYRDTSRVTEDRLPVPTVGSKNNWLTKNNESELEMMKLFCILGSVTCAFMLGKVHQNVTSKQAHFTAWKSYLNRANFKKRGMGTPDMTWFRDLASSCNPAGHRLLLFLSLTNQLQQLQTSHPQEDRIPKIVTLFTAVEVTWQVFHEQMNAMKVPG